MSKTERKQEVINVCLETFMKKGLTHTSTRDLCEALHLNTGGVFWYFDTKDEIIIACAEAAAVRIEKELIGVALKDIEDPEKLRTDLRVRSEEMRPLMKFFVSVCACQKYEDAVQHTLENLTSRYQQYTKKFAKKLNCSPEEIAPYVYIVINTMLSYMLFGKSSFVAPQLDLVYDVLKNILEKRKIHAEG